MTTPRRNVKNTVVISKECALYLEKCEKAILKVAKGQTPYNPNFDLVKHNIFHEELAHAIESIKL